MIQVLGGHQHALGCTSGLNFGLNACFLEGQGNLVSRLIMGVMRVTIWVIGVINLVTKSH